jgi:6-phosphogluconolactonase (cycloisomerase 2 family)
MQNEDAGPGAGFVYMQTNEPERNRLLAFRRAGDGTLTPAGAYETGGAGDGMPHLTSQGSVVLSGAGRYLLVTNTSSGDLSVFAVGQGGLSLVETVATGRAPKSAAEHGGLVYVLNTGEPSLAGFRLGGWKVRPLAGSRRELAAGTDPAQVGFSPDGARLVVTQRGTNAIAVYPVLEAGQLGKPLVQPSSGPTPYGFAFTKGGGLVVAEAFGAQAGKAAASSYRISDAGVAPVSRSVGNGRSEICWAVVTSDGRYAFTTNFGDGAVSRYSIGDDGSIALDEAAAGLAVDGQTGLRDEDLSGDGRFLYAIDADSRRVFGWAVGAGGSLSPVGSWQGLPATVAGLAAS